MNAKWKTLGWFAIALLGAMTLTGVALARETPASVPQDEIWIAKKSWWGGGDTSLSGGAAVELTGMTMVMIPAGTTVRWTNLDNNHDVHIEDEAESVVAESPNLMMGEAWSYRFDQPGMYHFHCDRHEKRMEHVMIHVM